MYFTSAQPTTCNNSLNVWDPTGVYLSYLAHHNQHLSNGKKLNGMYLVNVEAFWYKLVALPTPIYYLKLTITDMQYVGLIP